MSRWLSCCVVLAALGAVPRHADARRVARPDELVDFVAKLAAPAALSASSAAHLSQCRVLVTPDGRVHRPCALSRADLVGDAADVELSVTTNTTKELPNSQYAQRYAVVDARRGNKLVASFAVVEIYGVMGNPDSPAPAAPAAIMWIRLIADNDAAAEARAGKLSAPPPIADYMQSEPGDVDTNQDAIDAWHARRDINEAVRNGQIIEWLPRTNVIGSGPGQQHVDTRHWTLKLTREGGVDVDGGGWLAVAITHYVGTPARKGAPAITYVAMIVETLRLTGGGSPASDLALVAFGIPQPPSPSLSRSTE